MLYQFPSGEWNNSINFGKEMSGESFKCRTENGIENLSSIFSALDIKTDSLLKKARLYSFNNLVLFE